MSTVRRDMQRGGEDIITVKCGDGNPHTVKTETGDLKVARASGWFKVLHVA